MNITDQDSIKKIEDLLLNRIRGIDWMYWDFNLSIDIGSKDPFLSFDEIEDFFKVIEVDYLGNTSLAEGATEPSSQKILKVILSLLKAKPAVLNNAIKRLFDTNDIGNNSSAHEGRMGKLNEKDRRRRRKKFQKKVRNGHRSDSSNTVIFAEGDSWFQFPRITRWYDAVRDVIDWLIKEDEYAVYSIAAGGDWFSNIFYAGEYIEELPKIQPDVFLISGGGNDLVGGERMAIMTLNPGHNNQNLRDLETGRIQQLIERRVNSLKQRKHLILDVDKYQRGLKFISDEFFQFINIYFVQYFVFLFSLSSHKNYKDMIIITQGYDYAIPQDGSQAFIISIQRLVNWFAKTGNWLCRPLQMKGIIDQNDQAAIMYAMITEFNEMLIQLAKSPLLKNLYHIDCRGVAESPKDWYDELHLKSRCYKKIARAIKDCIRDNQSQNGKGKQKIYQAKRY